MRSGEFTWGNLGGRGSAEPEPTNQKKPKIRRVAEGFTQNSIRTFQQPFQACQPTHALSDRQMPESSLRSVPLWQACSRASKPVERLQNSVRRPSCSPLEFDSNLRSLEQREVTHVSTTLKTALRHGPRPPHSRSDYRTGCWDSEARAAARAPARRNDS